MRKGLLFALLGLLGLAAPAQADSIAYAEDGHVYLAYPDGSHPTKLTTGEDNWGAVSVADDGTIAATRGGGPSLDPFTLNTLDRTGKVLTSVPVPAHTTNWGGVYWARISPDGTKIAYEMTYYPDEPDPTCPLTPAECAGDTPVSFTAVTEVDELSPIKSIAFFRDWLQPSWIGSDRLLMTRASGAANAGVATIGAGATTVMPWTFGDGLHFYGGTVNRQGTRAAFVTGLWDRITVWNVAGQIGASPASWCSQMQQPAGMFQDPSWSPEGDRLAWYENDGIYVYAPSCTTGGVVPRVLASDGVHAAYWGPGDIPGKARPQPTPTPTPTPAPPVPTPTPTPQPKPAAPPTIAASGKLPKLRTLARKRKLAATVRCDGACKLSVTATIASSLAKRLKIKPVIARGRAEGSGAMTVQLRLARKTAKKLARQKKLTVTLGAAGTQASGLPVATEARLTLRR